MEKDLEEIKQINTMIRNFSVKLTLLDQAIKLFLRNSYTSECFEGLYTFDQFSEPVKNNFQSVSEIYEEIQNIVNQKNNSKIEMAAQRLLIDENNNFIFKYGVFKKNKVQFRPQILETKRVAKIPLKQSQVSSQIQELIKKNIKLQSTLQKVLIRLQYLETALEIYQKKQQKIEQQAKIVKIEEIQKTLESNKLSLKLQNNEKILFRIENQQGFEFESTIKKQDIPEEIIFLYAQITDLYKQFVHILNKENKKTQGKKISIDKNYNIQLQIQFQRAGQKLIKRGIFKTKTVQFNKLQKIQRTIRLNDKKQNQFTLNIQESLFKKINKVNEDSQKLKIQLANFGNKFTQRLNSLEKNMKFGLQQAVNISGNKYFDTTHPNIDKFIVTNNKIAHKSTNNTFIHIMSPIRISSSFSTYSYKAITSPSYNMMYGLASKQLKNNQTAVYTSSNFVGYYGSGTGYAYDQNNRAGSSINKGGITAGDQVKIQVNLNAKKVTFFKNGAQLYSSTLSDSLAKKQLYPALILYNNGDTVQMNF